jgi:hypothetical protein
MSKDKETFSNPTGDSAAPRRLAAQPPRQTTLPSIDADEEVVQTPVDRSPTSRLRKQSRSATSLSASSSVSTSSSESSILISSVSIGQAPVSKAQHAVEQPLDRLFRLTAVIRKSAILNRYAKAATFVEFDKEGTNLTLEFKTVAAHMVRQLLPDTSETLRQRLVETISLRQRQYSYSRRHQQNLAQDRTSLEGPESQAKPLQPTGSVRITPKPSRPTTKPSSEAGTVAGRSVAHSQSSASKIDPTQSMKKPRTRTSSVTSGTQILAHGSQIPSPPSIQPGGNEFICPYCFIVQSKDMARGEKWE